MTQRLEPIKEVIRHLFALSGNRCAFPGCNHHLISAKGKFIANICHIEGVAGERFNPLKTAEDLRKPENLLLMCLEHHVETNDQVEYPVSKMQEIKRNHEARFLNDKYELPEQFAERILIDVNRKLDELLELTRDTNKKATETLQLLRGLVTAGGNAASFDYKKIQIDELDAIREYRIQNKQEMVITMLIDYKKNNWLTLTPELKYRVNMNLALAYFDVHREQDALPTIDELENINHKTQDCWALMAMGAAIRKNRKSFNTYFKEVAAINKHNLNAWLAKIMFWPDNKPIVLEKIPKQIRNESAVLLNVARVMDRQGNRKSAILTYLKAVDAVKKNDSSSIDIIAIVGTKLVEYQANPFKAVFNHFSGEERQLLDRAMELLTRAWEMVKDNDLKYSRYYVLVNRGVGYRMKHKVKEAIKDFEHAYNLSGQFICVQNLLHMYLSERSLGLAEELLINVEAKPNWTTQQNFEIAIMRMRWLFIQQRLDEGLALMVKYLDKSSEFSEAAYEMLVPFLMEQEQKESALKYAQEFIKRFPDNINAWLDSGTVYESLENMTEAKAHYTKAYELINADTKTVELFFLAKGLSTTGCHKEAGVLFERIVDENILNKISRGLIHSWFADGDTHKAWMLARRLYSKYPQDLFLSEILINIALEVRDFQTAAEIFEQLLPVLPEEHWNFFLLKAVDIYNELNNKSRLLQLAEKMNAPQLKLQDGIWLCSVLFDHGFDAMAISIAMNFRGTYFNEVLAHEQFVHLFKNIREQPLVATLPEVSAPCIVVLQRSDKQEVIFNWGEMPMPLVAVLNQKDNFSENIVGKKTGDIVVQENIAGRQTNYRIKEIWTVEAFAIQQSMNLLTTRFAGQTGFELRMPQGKSPGEGLEMIFKKSRRTGPMDIGELPLQHKYINLLSLTMENNTVAEYFNSTSLPEQFLVTHSINEHEMMQQALSDKQCVLLDATALLTQWMVFGNAGYLEELTARYIVGQATLDECKYYLKQIRSFSITGHTAVGYYGGKILNHQIHPETVQEHCRTIEAMIAWCENNCKIRRATQIEIMHREQRKEGVSRLGAAGFEITLLAMEYCAAVLSDNENFKKILRQEYKTNTFGTYSASLHLHRAGKINDEEFIAVLFQLIEAGYIYIPAPPSVTWKALEACAFNNRKPFTTATLGFLVMKEEYLPALLEALLYQLYTSVETVINRLALMRTIMRSVEKHTDIAWIKLKLLQNIVENKDYPAFFKNMIVELIYVNH